ncbi:MAG: hypothetical protein FD124_2124 [Alphaproteobacteria bacterium]|nr:MAG: hypothetical protein FD124_2124 [Alphaproteobacteria bacterium]
MHPCRRSRSLKFANRCPSRWIGSWPKGRATILIWRHLPSSRPVETFPKPSSSCAPTGRRFRALASRNPSNPETWVCAVAFRRPSRTFRAARSSGRRSTTRTAFWTFASLPETRAHGPRPGLRTSRHRTRCRQSHRCSLTKGSLRWMRRATPTPNRSTLRATRWHFPPIAISACRLWRAAMKASCSRSRILPSADGVRRTLCAVKSASVKLPYLSRRTNSTFRSRSPN